MDEELLAVRILPQQLVEARKAAGLSMAEAARRLGIVRQRLNHYEKGHDRPYGDIVARMCRLYNCRIEDLSSEKNFACL